MDDPSTRTRRVTIAGRSATELLYESFHLEVEAGPDEGKDAALKGPSLTVGKGSDCDLTLSDAGVSRHHCTFALTADGVQVEDNESTNGTFIEGIRTRSGIVPDGGAVTVGETRLRVHVKAQTMTVFPGDESSFHGIVSSSPAMREVFALIRQLAQTDLPVAITGETGTGKELAAHAMHLAGPRKDRPFLVLDCGSVVPDLLRTELFGHEKGAFTGADQARAGILESAEGGTVFLDEVGELALDVQPSLLRALEGREITRVGSTAKKRVDFRLVSATNRDLLAWSRDGKYRADLYYRLSSVCIRLPALRERTEDLPALVDHFLKDYARRNGGAVAKVEDATLEALAAHDWPGNIRELRNIVDAMAALSGGKAIGPEQVARLLPGGGGGGPVAGGAAPSAASGPVGPESLAEAEREVLLRALEETGWNKKAAARKLGISHTTMFAKIKKYGLQQGG